MGWGLRRSLKLGHLKLNFSKSGVGYSIGARGFRVGKDAKGRSYTAASIPGTGLYNRTYTSEASFGRGFHQRGGSKEHEARAWTWARSSVRGWSAVRHVPDGRVLFETSSRARSATHSADSQFRSSCTTASGETAGASLATSDHIRRFQPDTLSATTKSIARKGPRKTKLDEDHFWHHCNFLFLPSLNFSDHTHQGGSSSAFLPCSRGHQRA